MVRQTPAASDHTQDGSTQRTQLSEFNGSQSAARASSLQRVPSSGLGAGMEGVNKRSSMTGAGGRVIYRNASMVKLERDTPEQREKQRKRNL